MTKTVYIIFIISLFFNCLAQSSKTVLVMNGTLHVGNGKVIANSAVAFKDGKFDLVADATVIRLDMSKFDTVINAYGKHIYPAMIAPNCILGLQDIEAVRASNDFYEVGQFNPHIRSLTSYNTDSKIIQTIKTNGVLYTQSTPRGGIISGSSSILATDGWNWEDAVLKMDDGIHLNFPKSLRKEFSDEKIIASKNTSYDEQLNELQHFFTDAQAYCQTKDITEANLRFEAMRGVFSGNKNLYIHADYSKDIIAAIKFCKQFTLKKLVIVGGKDSWKLTKLLRENKVSVMINRLHDLPELPEGDIDITYKLPYLLQKDSVLFCLQNQGDMEAMNARNIPFLAGTACAYGLSKEEALASITYNTAKILGIDSLVGSIEPGRLASFVISDGDVLDMKTNNIQWAFINGRKINLTNFQTELYQKYQSKYGLKKEN